MAVTQGEEVRDWQKSLSELGYKVEQDGKWGPKTSAATKEFQKEIGTEQTGKVGKTELDAAKELLSGTGKLSKLSLKPGFWKKPLFFIAATGAVLVAFTIWRDKE